MGAGLPPLVMPIVGRWSPWISSKLSTLGITSAEAGPWVRRRARALTARRDFSVDGRRLRIHSEQVAAARPLWGSLCMRSFSIL
jgi:hypothetical protein